MNPSERGRASERDREREHFRRIGEAKAQSHRDAFERHMALSLEERLVRSLAWTLLELERHGPGDRSDDDPAAFYARARELGLYRG
jgi:hypothetical protein